MAVLYFLVLIWLKGIIKYLWILLMCQKLLLLRLLDYLSMYLCHLAYLTLLKLFSA